jgi:hypothetical protein
MNSFKKIKYVIAITLFFAVLNNAYSQKMNFEEIQVVAPYLPTISEAFKILENPSMADTTTVKTNFEYSIKPLKISTAFDVEPISPARMRGEPLAKLYKGYIKAGIGTHATPYAEIFYGSLRANEYAYGIRAKHLSSSGTIENYDYSQFSDNLLNVYGKRFYRNLTVNADLNYQRDMVHYYGFQRDDFTSNQSALDFIDGLSGDQIKQSFNIFSAGVNYNTSHLDSAKLNHSAGINYRLLSDRYDASEHKFSLGGNLGKRLPPDPLGFAETQYFKLFANADFYNYTISDIKTTRGLISLEPRLSSQYRDFNFYIGVDITTQIENNTYLKFYPQAHAEANLVHDVLIAYGTFSGGMEKHDLYNTTRANPYMNTQLDMPLRFMNKKSDLTGGFKGSISSYVAYNFSISNAEIDKFAFFVNDTTQLLNNKFTIVYDNIRRFNFHAEIFTQIGERFRIRLATDYYEYSLFDEIEAWHLPTVVVTGNIKYNIQDKFILSLDAYARNSTYARGFDNANNPVRIELEGFHVDTNIGIEYRYTRVLSIFLNFNNIQNQPLQQWYNYPTQRFNFLGGVTYSF